MRHGIAIRIVHWVIVSEGAFLILTGFQMGGILYVGIPEDIYSYHIIVGFAFIGTAFIFFSEFLAARDWKWFSFRRIPYSIRFIFSEALGWFRLRPPPPDPIKYDAIKHRYVEKLIPSVIVVWWSYLVMGVILALTGLADAFPAQFWFVSAVLNPIGVAATGVDGLPLLLAIHRLTAVLLIVTVALHFYASAVYHLVPSIIRGYRREPVAEESPTVQTGKPRDPESPSQVKRQDGEEDR
jgi:formate dehydrogenase subunit gamma